MLSAIVLHRSGAGLQSRAALIGAGSALGGTMGNLLDILRRRSIVDFIDLGWWPAFNLADVGHYRRTGCGMLAGEVIDSCDLCCFSGAVSLSRVIPPCCTSV
jgi:lipoprotein signal peptidase